MGAMAVPKIGDKKSFVPSAFSMGLPADCEKRVTGTVVWIHPQNRFYIVEVEVHGHKWRQSFNINE